MGIDSLSRTRERVGVRVMDKQPLQDRRQNTVVLDQCLPIVEPLT